MFEKVNDILIGKVDSFTAHTSCLVNCKAPELRKIVIKILQDEKEHATALAEWIRNYVGSMTIDYEEGDNIA